MKRLLVLGLAAALPACQTFSSDGGLSVVADVAGPALRTDVVALNTPEDLEAFAKSL